VLPSKPMQSFPVFGSCRSSTRVRSATNDGVTLANVWAAFALRMPRFGAPAPPGWSVNLSPKLTAPSWASGPTMTNGLVSAGWPPIQLSDNVREFAVFERISPAELPATTRMPTHWLVVHGVVPSFSVRPFAAYVAPGLEVLALPSSMATGEAGAALV